MSAVTIAYIGFYPVDYAYISQDFFAATVPPDLLPGGDEGPDRAHES